MSDNTAAGPTAPGTWRRWRSKLRLSKASATVAATHERSDVKRKGFLKRGSQRLLDASSKLLRRPPPPPLPEPVPALPAVNLYDLLPPELWLRVIAHATDTTPDPHLLSKPHSFVVTPSLRLSAHRRATQNALALTLTNHAFRALAESALYNFIWIERAPQAKALARTLLTAALVAHIPDALSPGRHIRHVQITTNAFERCAPEDLHAVLSYAPLVRTFTDDHSVQRARYDPAPDARTSPRRVLELLARPHGELRRLMWTTYDDAPFDVEMGPVLRAPGACAQLEYLELSTWSAAFDAGAPLSTAPGSGAPVVLPALRSLKVSLDDTTFAVLAGWAMPALANLSVVAADFSYAGPGFAGFFRAHGAAVRELELGHSSGQLAEQRPTPAPGQARLHERIRLAEWCPNMETFVCSADAEWAWLAPDGVAPHALLPAHPKLAFIGIRDLDARLAAGGALLRGDEGTEPAGFFALLEQLGAVLRPDAFPLLRFVRDLSPASHALRARCPQARVTSFWLRVLLRCRERGVWMEDYEGYNVTMPGLRRASLRIGER